MNRKILVVEDDEMTNKVITNFLQDAGYDVTSCIDGEVGRQMIDTTEFQLIILDIMLPNIDGTALLTHIRKSSQVPVIMLTALDDEYTQVVSFTNKADDYVTKPFSPTILVKRVEAILRRNQSSFSEKKQSYGPLTIDFDAKMVARNEQTILLTKTEYDIVELLIMRIGKVVTREQLLDSVWGYESSPSDRIIDTHMKNIRKKVEELQIKTVHRVGYLLKEYSDED